MFFALQLPHNGVDVSWWGNDIINEGCEGSYGCPNLAVPDEGYFGATPGTYA